VNVLVGGQVVRSAPGRDDEFLNMATLDLGDFLGKPARIQVVDAATGGWGHINADHFVLSDTAATPPVKARTIDTSRLYDETFRPQFHFTAQKGWLNDPNGLVHFAGEYHLFFQHNPYGREWGNMTWGHAVSPDLIHWQQLDHALWPDRMGTMFSGSAVVDWQNTAGFQTGKEPALVAIYTAAGGTSEESKGQPFTQCLAYSNDRGRTWTKYAGNPVVPNVGDGDRDPKVFWHVPTKRWVMPLYVGEKDPVKKDAKGNPTTRHVCHFYTSPDLKVWSFASKFAEELYECPGFFELPVDGHKGRSKWVLFGANGDYWLGRFDGSVFTAESPKLKGDYGANAYAAQAFDDLPDHRVVLVNWMNGGKYPGMPHPPREVAGEGTRGAGRQGGFRRRAPEGGHARPAGGRPRASGPRIGVPARPGPHGHAGAARPEADLGRPGRRTHCLRTEAAAAPGRARNGPPHRETVEQQRPAARAA
jgi:hypothetical protein